MTEKRGGFNWQKHEKWVYLTILIILALVYFRPFLDSGAPSNDDTEYFDCEYVGSTVSEHHQFWFWDVHNFGGQPFYEVPDKGLLDFNKIWCILFAGKESGLKLNLGFILYSLIGGLGMFFLVYLLHRHYGVAFLAAILYMYNGYAATKFHFFSTLGAYYLAPYVFLVLWTATRSHNDSFRSWTTWGIVLGLVLGIQFHQASPELFIYTMYAVAFYLGMDVLFSARKRPEMYRKILKGGVLLAVALIVILGITLVKLMPDFAYNDKSYRASITYKWTKMISPPFSDISQGLVRGSVKELIPSPRDVMEESSANLGLVAALIALLGGIVAWHKRRALYSILMMLLGVMIAISGSPIQQLFVSVAPGFDKVRLLQRALFLFAFFGTVLFSYGAYHIVRKTEKRTRIKHYVPVAAIALLMVMELFLTNPLVAIYEPLRPWPADPEYIQPNEVLGYIAQDEGIYRIHVMDIPLVWGGSIFDVVRHGSQMTQGWANGIFIPEYAQVESSLLAYNFSQFLLVNNVKYVISQEQPITDMEEHLELDGILNASLYPNGINLTYVYEVRDALPRIYHVDTSIGVYGGNDQVNQMSLGMIVTGIVDPRRAALISYVDPEIGFDEVARDSHQKIAILMGGDIPNGYIEELRRMHDANGLMVVPDIFQGEQQTDPAKLEADTRSLVQQSPEGTELNITHYSPNRIEVDVSGKDGVMLLSERFYYFEGWEAKGKPSGREYPILQANRVMSAVVLSGDDDTVAFTYREPYFYSLLLLMLVTFVGSLVFVYRNRDCLKK